MSKNRRGMKQTYTMWAYRNGKRFGSDYDGVVLTRCKRCLYVEDDKKIRVRVVVEEIKESK